MLWSLTLFNGSALTFVHEYWENQSFDYIDFCQQSLCFFNILSRFVITFLPTFLFNFIDAVTVCSDFGAQENKEKIIRTMENSIGRMGITAPEETPLSPRDGARSKSCFKVMRPVWSHHT